MNSKKKNERMKAKQQNNLEFAKAVQQVLQRRRNDRAKFICATCVRFVDNCSKCLWYKECKNHDLPISKFALYVAKMNIEVLPKIAAEINAISFDKYGFVMKAPQLEAPYWAYARIKCYNVKTSTMLFDFYIGNELDEEALRQMTMENFIISKINERNK